MTIYFDLAKLTPDFIVNNIAPDTSKMYAVNYTSKSNNTHTDYFFEMECAVAFAKDLLRGGDVLYACIVEPINKEN